MLIDVDFVPNADLRKQAIAYFRNRTQPTLTPHAYVVAGFEVDGDLNLHPPRTKADMLQAIEHDQYAPA